MRFARIVFWIAGIWGFLVLTPMYFLYDTIGQQTPPPLTHPGFYYGFLGTGLAWQLAFLIIGSNPVRYRPLIVPVIFEKFLYGVALIILYEQKRIVPKEMVGLTDLVWGVLFVIAFWTTKPSSLKSEMYEM